MPKVDYWVVSPNKTRKSFTLYQREDRKGGTPVKDSRLAAINKAYKIGTLDFSTAKQQVLKIKNELKKVNGGERYPICEANTDLFEKYWATKYRRRKSLEDSKRSAKNYYLRALASIGSMSLLSSSIEDLQFEVDKLPSRKQRRVCNCLNRLLAFYGRTERLAAATKQDFEYRYLDEKEFKLILRHIWSKEQRLVCEVAFYSGLRLGEIFAAREFHERDLTLFVEKQMYEDGTLAITKNKKKRRAFVCPSGASAVKSWLKVPTNDRKELRKLPWAKIVKRACKLAFPKSPEKQLNFHDLRHSYAIYCMSKGLSLTVVAASIGDGLTVAQEYYARFEKTSELGQLAKRLWRAS